MDARTLYIKLKKSLAEYLLEVDTHIPLDGVTVIFGRSGSGKTTLLRSIAGLTEARGELRFGSNVWMSDTCFVPPHQRTVGFVFQDARLFPHLTVEQNLAFARKRAEKALPIPDIEIIKLLNLEPLLPHCASALSGGEQQRVAIARALFISPELLLMDEPLASLDYTHRQEILSYLERLKQQLNLPVLYVTHSADELSRLADHLLVLEQGKVVGQGALNQVLAQMDFPIRLGDERGVVISGKVTAERDPWGLGKVSFDGGELWVQDKAFELGQSVRVRVLARDVSVSLSPAKDSSIVNILQAEIDGIAEQRESPLVLIRAMVGAQPVLARLTRRSLEQLKLTEGQKIWLQIKSAALVN